MWMTVFEAALVAVGVLASVATGWALYDNGRATGVLWSLRVNGGKRRVVLARVVRDACRLFAAVAILAGGVVGVTYPPVLHPVAITMKLALLTCGVALLVTVGVDTYTRHEARQ